jgi:hypothetical protein
LFASSSIFYLGLVGVRVRVRVRIRISFRVRVRVRLGLGFRVVKGEGRVQRDGRREGDNGYREAVLFLMVFT